MLGNTPLFAMALGNSACSRIQPLSAPKPLIAANTASSLPAALPQYRVTKSTKGAFDSATFSAGSSSSTAVQARMQISAVTIAPSSVARGMMRLGSRTLSAGVGGGSKHNKGHKGSVAGGV